VTPRALASAIMAVAVVSGCGGSDKPGKSDKGGKGGEVTRSALGATPDPTGAAGETLELSRVVVPPGAKLPLHYHPGTQVAFIDKGVLTYTVDRGTVTVMRGSPGEHPSVVRRIAPGQTATIRAGDWIVEHRSDIHRAENRGEDKVVVLLSTLLRNGAPAAIPVAHTGHPGR
jgi:quercetin dioxygenase-like cupin family protein